MAKALGDLMYYSDRGPYKLMCKRCGQIVLDESDGLDWMWSAYVLVPHTCVNDEQVLGMRKAYVETNQAVIAIHLANRPKG